MQFHTDWFATGGKPIAPITNVAAFRELLHQQIQRHFVAQKDAQLVSVTPIIDEARFELMTALATDTTDCFIDRVGKPANSPLPAFLTFHGTSSPEVLQSICKYGYLLPGQQHPKHGYALDMRVGNVFGTGVYTSSSIETASWYARQDGQGDVVLIVNALFPGKVSHVCRNGWFGATAKDPFGPNTTRLDRLFNLDPSPSTNRYPFAQNANTLTPDFRSMWIAASPLQVWPVAMVKIHFSSAQAAYNSRPAPWAPSTVLPLWEKESTLDNVATIRMTQLVGDYFALPSSVYKTLEETRHLRRYFVLPASLLYDRSFATAMQHHVKSVCAGSKNDVVVIYGGDSVNTVPVAQFEAAAARLMIRHKRHDAEAAIRAALDMVCAAPRQPPVYHVLHLFGDLGTTLSSDAAEAIGKEYGPPCRSIYVNAKCFFSRHFDASKNTVTRDAFLRVKYHTQMEGIFETLYFDLNPYAASTLANQPAAAPVPTSWASVLDSNEDELCTIGGTDPGSYLGSFQTVPFNLSVEGARFGEGFVTGIDEIPLHHGTFNGMVLYKGAPPAYLSVENYTYCVEVCRFIGSTDPTHFETLSKKDQAKKDKAPRPHETAWQAARRRASERHRLAEGLIEDFGTEFVYAPDGSRLWKYVASNVAALLGLLSKFRNTVVESRDKLAMYGGTLETFACNIRALCNDKAMDVVVGRRLSAAVAQVIGEINTLSSLKFYGEWFVSFQRMRYGRSLVRRIASQEKAIALAGGQQGPSAVTEENVLEAMEELDVYGVPLRVIRSAAAEVEPWTIVIEYIAVPHEGEDDQPDEVALASESFRASLLEMDGTDANGRSVNALVAWPFHPPTSPFMQAVAAPRDQRKKRPLPITRQALLEHYYAQVFTRNPLLVLKQQGAALRTSLWVRLTEILLIRSRPGPAGRTTLCNDAPLKDVLKFATELAQSLIPYFTVRLRDKKAAAAAAAAAAPDTTDEGMMEVQHSLNLDDVTKSNGDEGDDSWTEISSPDTTTTTTTTTTTAVSGVEVINTDLAVSHTDIISAPSLVQTLGYLLAAAHAKRAAGNTELDAGATVKFDLLAESIVRMMHSFARARKVARDELLLWLFGIAAESVIIPAPGSEASLLDVERCCRRTGRLFKYALSNCTPFAVVSALGWIRLYETGASQDDVLANFANRAVSMKAFLEQNAPGDVNTAWQPSFAQLALFAFAAATHDRGSQRQSFSAALHLREGPKKALTPMQYVTLLLTEQLETITKRREARAALGARLANRAQMRKLRLQDEIAVVLRDHAAQVKLFTDEDVQRMNHDLERRIALGEAPADTLPFERTPSGLLRHHCCYPSCPQFLQQVASASDLAAMAQGDTTRNHGMRKHLARNLDAGIHVPGFHLAAKSLYRGSYHLLDFARVMDAHFANCGRYKQLSQERHDGMLAAAFAFHEAARATVHRR